MTSRTLLAEANAVTSFHEALQRSKRCDAGLLVALLGSKSDTLLRLIPAPADEGVAPNTVDPSWVLEHGKQVARMLPGGVGVLGCYVFAPTADLSGHEAKLQPVLASLAKLLPAPSGEAHAALLLLPSDAKKATCRSARRSSSRRSSRIRRRSRPSRA